MASGFGVKGNKGRCYAFWMDFSKCMSEADHPTSCAALREDYLECLHHRKEARRRPDPPADGLACETLISAHATRCPRRTRHAGRWPVPSLRSVACRPRCHLRRARCAALYCQALRTLRVWCVR
jgi:hypothetical protein